MIRRALAPAAVAVLLAACGADTPADESADLLVTNARVVTVDDTQPEAEAVAVRGSRILAVGSAAEMEAYRGEGTEVIDADGRLVIPGFIEGHGHFTGLGDARMILDLTTVTSWEEIVDMVAAAVADAPAGTLIRGRGWHQEKWTSTPEPQVDGVPHHDALSAVSPDHPVYLTHASGHAAFVNGRALEMAGIDADTPDPAGGTIVRDASGRATGLLRETAAGLASGLGGALTPEEEEARFRRVVELAGAEALSKGVTSFHDAGTGFGTVDGYRTLADAGELPIRLYVMIRAGNEALAANLDDYRLDGHADGFLTVRSIKRSIDGALGSHGAWLLEPYDDLPSSAGLNTAPVDDVAETARLAAEHGYQLNVHAIGDRANREVLDIYERTWQAGGLDGEGLRWRIEHAQHLHPDDIPRFAELGVIAAMQGVHGTSDGPWVPEKLGALRAARGAYMWRALWDSGAIVTNGTDTPVEDVDPIASYYSMVSRMTNTGQKFHPEQALDRMESLKAYTINNAIASFQEDDLGSITPGKYADLVILSKDILAIDEAEIPSAEVDVTILGGRVAYRR